MIIKNNENIFQSNQDLSWDFYLKKINNIDSFKTRYYHYLRWRSVLQYVNFILKYVKSDAKVVLDIGCNRGYYSEKPGEIRLKMDPVDLNLDSYQIISNSNVTYFEGDFLNWVPTRKYDLIMAFEVYEHIHPNEREAFIQKIVNLLHPGGILLFTGPNCFSLYYGMGYVKDSLKKVFGSVEEVNWHYRISCQYYNHIFASQNFEIINWNTNGVFPVLSNKLECLLIELPTQPIIGFDLFLSKIFKGFGANYFAILRKGDTFER